MIQKLETKQFTHIISLGSFCSPALEIERLGMRDGSYPFDWVLSHSFEEVMALIDNKFDDFLNESTLYQAKNKPMIYINPKHNIVFIHDFSAFDSLENQFPQVLEKYNRRISKFYQAILQPTLFLR
ncbi:papain-like cysteine peptidase, partial [Lachnospiraceae bacterium OttesenSCG-928-D06]|nr:papain-like cysteine peptidase [Lachnospiraceae bacterium OttesenSCG-928-D06]